MAYCFRGKMMLEMALKRRRQDEVPCGGKIPCGPEAPQTKKKIVLESVTCDPASNSKTWTVLDNCLDISFPEFGSDELFCSTPDTTLVALMEFPFTPSTALLPAPEPILTPSTALLPAPEPILTPSTALSSLDPILTPSTALLPAPEPILTPSTALSSLDPILTPSTALLPAPEPILTPSTALLPAPEPILTPSTALLPAPEPILTPSTALLPAPEPILTPSTALLPAPEPILTPSTALLPAPEPILTPSTALLPAPEPILTPSTALLPAPEPILTPSTALLSAPEPILTPSTALLSAPEPILTPSTALLPAPEPILTPSTALLPAPEPILTPSTALLSAPEPILTPSTALLSAPEPILTPSTALLPAPEPILTPSTALLSAPEPILTPSTALLPAPEPILTPSTALLPAPEPILTPSTALLPAPEPILTPSTALLPAPEPILTPSTALLPAPEPILTPSTALLSAPEPIITPSTALLPAPEPILTPSTALLPAPEPILTPSTALLPAPEPILTPSTALLPAPEPILTPSTALLSAPEPILTPSTALLPAPEPILTPSTALLPAPEPILTPSTALLPAPEPTLTPSKAPPMRDPCGQKCRRKYTDKFSEERRKEIWNMYWDMDYTDRRAFMFHSVNQVPTAKSMDSKTSRRGRSFAYRLKNEDQVPQQVCKTFFLATLGYHPTNDSLVLSVMGKEIGNEVITRDQRGRHTPANKLDNKHPVYDHIESFHPSVSHYRREHAPHRRYLPSDITIKLMYDDYLEKGNSCSYESYRKAVKHENISFAKLGEEECEECLLQDQHIKKDHDGDGHDMDCLQCQRWCGHKESAVQSRMRYQADAEKDWPEDTLVKSVDLQKVIMLPRMPGLKTSIFTKRIVAFHETFASVGKKKNKKNTISVVWHEGMAGRSAAEITSAYVTALKKERDICHSIFWVDNCSAQNKNWCLLSSLVCLVNVDTTSMEDITLKYFEKGHTFMSADSFVSVVSCSNSRKVEVVAMKNVDVLNWKDGHSAVKIKKATKLGEMAVIQLRRGSRSLFFKKKHEEDHFTELDFLRVKFDLKVPSLLRPHDRGIEAAKKYDIIKKLCPFMPPNRRAFWSALPESNVEEDEE